MLELAICDDSKAERKLLLSLIKSICSDRNMKYDFETSSFTCGEDLINHYEDGGIHFDIIFLDIYMADKTGIETARQIRKYDAACKIIFITTSMDHALDGYSVFAYNYLVKPVTPQIFASVLKKALEGADSEKKKALYVKSGNKLQLIPYKDIKYIESQGRITKIFTLKGEEISCYLKLDDIESALTDPRFLRSHKSFLVNMDCIVSVKEYFFTLFDNTDVAIRQKGFTAIKKKYCEFIIKRVD